ncbi:MAG TPA: oxygenase MpaB family protein [Allosphingosinicella sp.]|nr:oxygenase MpaB family protein [Allosphingosinicella sp.]
MRPALSEPDPADVLVLPGVLRALASTNALIARSVVTLSPEDPGYFGPGSMSWRIFSHASYGASGIAAVLVQALHPVAIAIVDRHSAFRSDAWRRAHLTADYVFTITFAGRRGADEAAAAVRRIHAGIGGGDPATGAPRRADEPELLLWVHAVHTEYALRGYEAFATPLSELEADRFVAEQVAAAALVGLDRAQVPANRAELRACLDSVAGLRVSEPARLFSLMLLRARMPATMRPFWALHVAAAALLLPPEVRTGYRLPRWLPRGRTARLAMVASFSAITHGYGLFRPVREARRRMREVERAQLQSHQSGGAAERSASLARRH